MIIMKSMILSITFVQWIQAAEIYVSMNSGNDRSTCGSIKNMCRSITYAVEVASDNDTIYIDGGKTEQIVYSFNKTIIINKSIHITKFNKLRPIISPSNSTITELFAFNILPENLFSLNSLQFNSMSILHRSSNYSSNCEVMLINCLVISNQSMHSIDLSSRGSLKLYLIRCKFIQSAILNVAATGSTYVYIDSSYVTGEIKITSNKVAKHNATVIFQNSTAARMASIYLNGCIQSEMKQTQLVNILTQKPILHVNGNNVCKETLYLHECIFSGNKVNNRVISVVDSTVQFNRSVIANNTAVYGNILELSKSTLKMYLTNVTNNDVKNTRNQKPQQIFVLGRHSLLNMQLCYIARNTGKDSLFRLNGYNSRLYILNCHITHNIHIFRLFTGLRKTTINITNSHIVRNTVHYIFHIHLENVVNVYSSIIAINTVNRSVFYAVYGNKITVIKCQIVQNTLMQNLIHGNGRYNTFYTQSCLIAQNTMTRVIFLEKHSQTVTVLKNNISDNSVHSYLFYIFETKKFTLASSRVVNNTGNTIFGQLSNIAIQSSVVIEPIGNNGFLVAYQSSVIIESSSIKYNSTGNTQLIRIHGDNTNIRFQKVNITCNFTTTEHSSIISIEGKNKHLDITDLFINIPNLLKETPVLFASVADTQTSTNNVKSVVAVDLECPASFLPNYKTTTFGNVYIEQSCKSCGAGLYTLKRSKQSLSGFAYKDVQNVLFNATVSSVPKCFTCPIGGKCLNGIKSSGNYYGYIKNDKEINFFICPHSYCCSKENKNCASYNSCNHNRRGILCGLCAENFYESFFSTNCVHKDKCTNQIYFWLLYIMSSFLLTNFLLYMNNIKNFLKYIRKFIKIKIVHKLPKKDLAQTNCNTCDRDSNVVDDHDITITVSPLQTERNSDERINTNYTISGIFASLVMFYQIRSLLTVNVSASYTSSFNINKMFEKIFNLDFSFTFVSSYCPTQNLNAISKLFMKNGLFTTIMLIFLAFVIFITTTVKIIKNVLRCFWNKPQDIQMNSNTRGSFNHQSISVSGDCICSSNSALERLNRNMLPLSIKQNEQDSEGHSIVYVAEIVACAKNCTEQGYNQSTGCSLKHPLRRDQPHSNQPQESTTLDNRVQHNQSRNNCLQKNKEILQEKPASISMYSKIGICYVRILLLSFKNIVVICVTLLQCVDINGQKHLFIFGDIVCFQWWQIFPLSLLGAWLITFPLALSVSFQLYRERYITFVQFLTGITFPLYIVYIYFCKKLEKIETAASDVQLQCLIEILEEPYRVNEGEKNFHFLWESWLLYEKLVLVVVAYYIIDPMLRTCVITPLIMVSIIIYWKIKPYKTCMIVLHWMTVSSLISFCFLAVYNMYTSVLYVFDLPSTTNVQKVLYLFQILDYFFTPIIVLVWHLILQPLVKKIVSYFDKTKAD